MEVVAIVIYCDFPITKKIKINVQPRILMTKEAIRKEYNNSAVHEGAL